MMMMMYFMLCTFGIFCVFVCVCVFLFLKATVRPSHEPSASSESMFHVFIFALYCICVSEQVNNDEK